LEKFIENADVLDVIEELEASDNEDFELGDYNVKITDIFEDWKKMMLQKNGINDDSVEE